jgi:hypothetical protein
VSNSGYAGFRPNFFMGLVPVILVIVWAAVLILMTREGIFVDRTTSLPLRLMPAVIIPPGTFLLAYWLLPRVRAWVSELDLALDVGVQTFRVIGIIFLVQWAQGDLPAVFAAPAGLGDIAVGIFALIVTVRVARDPRGNDGAIRALIIAGFIDFAAAFTFATLASRGMPLAPAGTSLPLAAQTLPTSLIPTFAVPLFMIAHIVALLKLGKGRTFRGTVA